MAVKQRSNKYWARRAEEGLNKALKTSASYERLINRVYTEASINLTQELQRLYKNAYKGDKSFDMDKLNALEPNGNVERFKAAMRRQGLYTKLPNNYKGRLTRLEMLDAQIWAEVKRAGQKETAYNTDAYRKIVNNGYKNAQSVIAKGTNTSFTFNKLNTGAVNTILNNQFDGANYSERIWGQTDVLANELQQKLATAVATGQNYERTAREFRQRFNVKKSYAERLIRTESCYFETEAKLQAYKDLGITELVFVATLDSRTSEICQHADGERIKISEAVVGENIPPLHPNCRSTVRAYIAEEFEPTERIARNEGNNNQRVDNITYKQWAESAKPNAKMPKAVAEAINAVPKGVPKATNEPAPLPAPDMSVYNDAVALTDEEYGKLSDMIDLEAMKNDKYRYVDDRVDYTRDKLGDMKGYQLNGQLSAELNKAKKLVDGKVMLDEKDGYGNTWKVSTPEKDRKLLEQIEKMSVDERNSDKSLAPWVKDEWFNKDRALRAIANREEQAEKLGTSYTSVFQIDKRHSIEEMIKKPVSELYDIMRKNGFVDRRFKAVYDSKNVSEIIEQYGISYKDNLIVKRRVPTAFKEVMDAEIAEKGGYTQVGLLSTSGVGVAERHTSGGLDLGNNIIEIVIPKGTKFMPLQKVAQSMEDDELIAQKEILLPANTTLVPIKGSKNKYMVVPQS